MSEFRRRLMMAAFGNKAPLVPEFHDRLVFDGTAFIETTLHIPSNGSIRATIGKETMKSSQNVWCTKYNSAQGEGAIRVYYGGGTNSTRRQMLPFYDSTSYLFSNKTLAFSYTSFGLFQTPKGLGWGSTNNTYTKGSATAQGEFCIGGLTGSSVNPFTGVMATIYIYDSTAQNVTTFAGFDSYTPVYTLRPCVYNGAAGLWCVETSTFFGNSAASGTLTVEDDA